MLKLGDLVRVDKKGWRGHTEKGKVVSDYLGQPGFQVELEDGELLFFDEKDLIKIKNKDEDYSICEQCSRKVKRVFPYTILKDVNANLNVPKHIKFETVDICYHCFVKCTTQHNLRRLKNEQI